MTLYRRRTFWLAMSLVVAFIIADSSLNGMGPIGLFVMACEVAVFAFVAGLDR